MWMARRLHGGVVVSMVASREGYCFKSCLQPFVWTLHVLPMLVWVLFRVLQFPLKVHKHICYNIHMFVMYQLPKHWCRHVPLYENSIPWWLWQLSAEFKSLPHSKRMFWQTKQRVWGTVNLASELNLVMHNVVSSDTTTSIKWKCLVNFKKYIFLSVDIFVKIVAWGHCLRNQTGFYVKLRVIFPNKKHSKTLLSGSRFKQRWNILVVCVLTL